MFTVVIINCLFDIVKQINKCFCLLITVNKYFLAFFGWLFEVYHKQILAIITVNIICTSCDHIPPGGGTAREHGGGVILSNIRKIKKRLF